MRSTDGSSYHVMLSGDNGVGSETNEKQLCISPRQLSVSYGNSTFYLQLRNSVIANAHIHCALQRRLMEDRPANC